MKVVVKKKKVKFDAIEIREYPVVLSDNPASLTGHAIEIGWEYRHVSEIQPLVQKNLVQTKKPKHKIDGTSVAILEYEKVRPSEYRRSVQKLYLYKPQRDHYVKQRDYSPQEIEAYRKEKERIIQSRRRSNFWRNPVKTFRENTASTRRHKKVRRAVRNLGKKEQEQKNDEIYSGWWLPWSAYIF